MSGLILRHRTRVLIAVHRLAALKVWLLDNFNGSDADYKQLAGWYEEYETYLRSKLHEPSRNQEDRNQP